MIYTMPKELEKIQLELKTLNYQLQNDIANELNISPESFLEIVKIRLKNLEETIDALY